MKIKVKELGQSIDTAILMWEEGKGDAKKKVIKKVVIGDTFDIDDASGYGVLATYPDLLEIVTPGSRSGSSRKSSVAPSNKMITEEEIKST